MVLDVTLPVRYRIVVQFMSFLFVFSLRTEFNSIRTYVRTEWW